MKKLRSILIACCLLAAATPILAQTPTPAASPAVGTVFMDGTASNEARLADVKAFLARPNNSQADIDTGTFYLQHLTLNGATTAAAWEQYGKALADQVIAAKGYVTPTLQDSRAVVILANAYGRHMQFVCKTPSERVAYFQPIADANPDVAYFQDILARQKLNRAIELRTLGNNADALALALDPSVLDHYVCVVDALALVSDIKSRTNDPAALGWAKVYYFAVGFNESSRGIQAVVKALRAHDGNVATGNAFIAAQNDATAANILAAVPVPDFFKNRTLPEAQFGSINALLRGDVKGALQLGQAAYIDAGTNDQLNQAVSRLAQLLRNVDGNLVRANAFVSAQKAGQSYPIAELK